ncbi:MAG: glycogen synthase [Bacteroidetes bacterium]|nr:glycogen synthase [Bacteroidota bacterium]
MMNNEFSRIAFSSKAVGQYDSQGHNLRVTVLTNEYPPNIYGGAGVHVKYLVRELAIRHQVQVYAFGDQRVRSDNLCVDGVSDLGAPKANDSRFERLFSTLQRNLSTAAIAQDTDVIHCHTWYSHWAGILAKQLTGAKLVLTTHSLEPHRPWKVEQLGHAYHVSSWIEKTAYQEADAIIAVSPQMKEDVISLYGVEPKVVHVIANGIDLDEYQPTFDQSVLRSYGINPDVPYVLFVGRVTRQKGIIHLLHAITHLDHQMQVVLAAGAPDTPEIEEEMIQEVNRLSQNRHHQIVWIREMMPPSELIVLYSHAQVFVCPSVYEPFGIINLEAMACETAVVATNVGGIPMVVQDERTGLLVELEGEGFAERLADKINELMRNPDRAREMGLLGRVRVEEHFSWRAVAKQTSDLYHGLVT